MNKKTIKVALRMSEVHDAHRVPSKLFTILRLTNTVKLDAKWYGLSNDAYVGSILSETEADKLAHANTIEVTVTEAK